MTTDEGVWLRPLRRDDAGGVLAAFRSNADMARQGDVTTPADAERYVENLLAPASAHRPWAVATGDGLAGLVCVSVDAKNRNGWFSYWMATAARGHGWMRRAAATVADWALTDGGLERLELGHRVNNPASGAVARAAGFVKEGTERAKFLVDGRRIDVDTYGRLRTDPPPRYEPLPMRGGAR
ncbi:GNAT family N-acetyltransferase [Microbacterium sediminis]|uniref:GNAT family acetyltransferase n=1 Tax=Microbacterium sediminis TaxID=904291 RepID=A0A1B9NG12_9MICO|nr:GNAT family protein [Microbacterium sediminis]OCG75520.1 GNAT family acetyltransferase [Microbacterium sediminis]QBR73914.1 N-acetyltransferase [Microbacterium sediminis]